MDGMAASLASDLFSLCAVNSQLVSLRCKFASSGGGTYRAKSREQIKSHAAIRKCFHPSVSQCCQHLSYILGQYPVLLRAPMKGTVRFDNNMSNRYYRIACYQ